MGRIGEAGKYGNGRTHDPRCNCPDCNGAFVQHQQVAKRGNCECEYCVQHREIYAPPPRVTRPEEMAEAQRIARESWQHDEESRRRNQQLQREERARDVRDAASIARYDKRQKRGKTVGNLNICERPACNAIIKGEAAGRVELETNISGDGERKLYVLCPPCVSDVDAVLHTAPTSERERAYDKPYEGYKPSSDSDDVKTATNEQLMAELMERMMREAASKTKALGSGEE